MTAPLIVLVAINWLVFAVLFALRVRAARRLPTRRLRTLSWVGAAVCGIFLVGASQRLGIQAARALELEQVEAYMTSVGQLTLTLVAMAVVAWGVYTTHRVGRAVFRADRMVSVLSSRIPETVAVSDLGMTARELEVLEQMSAGNVSDPEIATAMSVTTATAATHVRNIMRKAELSSRGDLLLLATRELALSGARR